MSRLSDLFENREIIEIKEDSFVISGFSGPQKKKADVNILAMGDVGSTLALALLLRGNDCINSVGICDLNDNVLQRFETEFNQISMPMQYDAFPQVRIVEAEKLFECDVFVFCASKGVPPVGDEKTDVRMVQLEGNINLIKHFAGQARKAGYEGKFFVVSDPVDPLCKGALTEGIPYYAVQGFGLGVMNGRAAYFAKKDDRFAEFVKSGRVFGPHGEDLVVADSIEHYDNEKSLELTKLTINANLKIREMGFKPYIAPAVASGALAVIENLAGNWHYSSVYFGKENNGAFLGLKNRRTDEGLEIENRELDEMLFGRIEHAYNRLKEIV